MRIGAELEFIPFDETTLRPVPIVSENASSSLAVLRLLARRSGWTEIPAGDDPPSWSLPDGGRVSFEPGGQIELSSAPTDNPSGLIRDLQCTAQLLSSAFANTGAMLETVGVDPYNDIADVMLQLHRPRYERMTRYFDSIGSSGVRMMRQTASLQINVDAGADPIGRWLLLNALAPYVVAIFANSPVYAGRVTGHKSYRSYLWRTLDPSRTGLRGISGNVVDSYLDFALGAGAMMRSDGAYGSFADWIECGEPTDQDWDVHVSTLFPEVRPRRYFELRSADTIAPECLAAPIVFVAGLLADESTSRAASELLGNSPGPSLEVAGREGLRNQKVAQLSNRLVDLALGGATSLGDAYISRADVDAAAQFFDCYTRQGRSPGDDRS
jgi:glutamate--cysteine ligase